MTALSANPSSVSEPGHTLTARALHLWFCSRSVTEDSTQFRRLILSRYARVAPAQWRFTTGVCGKPELVDAPIRLAFNVSDSGDWLVCAITAGAAVGVDLEETSASRDVLRLARRFYCASEVVDISACDSAVQQSRFYEYWTLKEASIKARGGALPAELPNTCFQLHRGVDRPGRIEQQSPPASADEWPHLCLLDGPHSTVTAVCYLSPGHCPPRLTQYQLLANGEYRQQAPTIRAASTALRASMADDGFW